VIAVEAYDASFADAWDDLVGRAANGTLLHTRRYLGYHGDRFADRSLVVLSDGKPVAVVPAALDPDDASCVVSHPGITYGGIVHLPSFRGTGVADALDACRAAWAAERVVYKPVPPVFHRALAQDDLWALFLAGATRTRCDLSWAVDLTGPMTWTGNRRRAAAKAAAEVEVSRDDGAVESFWHVLTDSLAERHGVRPVHTAEEMRDLMRRCPGEIALYVARRSGEVVAGSMVYVAGAAWHSQYLASGPAGREVGALDAVVAHVVEEARASGAKAFDFGISNEDRGRTLNEGLYFYKSSFGGGSVVHEQYAL
jgi:GNAT superfamily N-acetyltransferase